MKIKLLVSFGSFLRFLAMWNTACCFILKKCFHFNQFFFYSVFSECLDINAF